MAPIPCAHSARTAALQGGTKCPCEWHAAEKKLYTKVAKKLTKIGGGWPTSRAVLKFFAKVDNDGLPAATSALSSKIVAQIHYEITR